MAKMAKLGLGQLQLNSTAEKTLAEAKKLFEAVILAVYITNHILFSCKVIHGDHLLF